VLNSSIYQKITFKNKDLQASFCDVQRGATLRNGGFVPRTTIFYEAAHHSAS
jgi:hypothetical protein